MASLPGSPRLKVKKEKKQHQRKRSDSTITRGKDDVRRLRKSIQVKDETGDFQLPDDVMEYFQKQLLATKRMRAPTLDSVSPPSSIKSVGS